MTLECTLWISVCLALEGEFSVGPSSREDVQRLWQLEKHWMQETLKKQKDAMAEDNQWLAKEEKLLV